MFKSNTFLFFTIGLSLSMPFEDRVAKQIEGKQEENLAAFFKTDEFIANVCTTAPHSHLEKRIQDIPQRIVNPLKNIRKFSIDAKTELDIFSREIYVRNILHKSSSKAHVLPINNCEKGHLVIYLSVEELFSLRNCMNKLTDLKPAERLQFYIKLLETYRDINMEGIAQNAINADTIFFQTCDKNDIMNPKLGFFGNAWINSDHNGNQNGTIEEPKTYEITIENKNILAGAKALVLPSPILKPESLKKSVPNTHVLNLEHTAVAALIVALHSSEIDKLNSFDFYFKKYKENPNGFYKSICPKNTSVNPVGIICDLQKNSFKGEDPYYYGNIIASFEAYKKPPKTRSKTKL